MTSAGAAHDPADAARRSALGHAHDLERVADELAAWPANWMAAQTLRAAAAWWRAAADRIERQQRSAALDQLFADSADLI